MAVCPTAAGLPCRRERAGGTTSSSSRRLTGGWPLLLSRTRAARSARARPEHPRAEQQPASIEQQARLPAPVLLDLQEHDQRIADPESSSLHPESSRLASQMSHVSLRRHSACSAPQFTYSSSSALMPAATGGDWGREVSSEPGWCWKGAAAVDKAHLILHSRRQQQQSATSPRHRLPCAPVNARASRLSTRAVRMTPKPLPSQYLHSG